MLKVSKVLVLSLLVVGLCAPLALATTSRVQALAGASNYINDDSDIFRWYGTLPSYSKMVMAEVGQTFDSEGPTSLSYEALGFTHNWGEDHWLGTWGVFLFKNSIEDPSYFMFNPLITPAFTHDFPGTSTYEDSLPSTKFAFAWGKDLGDLSLGLLVTRSDWMDKPGTPPTALKTNYTFTTIGGGVRLDMNDKLYADGAVTVGIAGGKPTTVLVGGVETATTWDKKLSYSLEGRLFWEFTDNATLTPYFGYRAAEFVLTPVADDSVATGDKWSDLTMGAGLNFDVNTNNMLVFAAELEWLNWKFSNNKRLPLTPDQTERSASVLPRFYVALESDVTSWFTTRVGATKTMVNLREKNALGAEDEITNPDLYSSDLATSDFAWFLGGGFHVGEWDIDAVFNPDLPFRLGYWLTGYGSDIPEPPVGRVSATYRF